MALCRKRVSLTTEGHQSRNLHTDLTDFYEVARDLLPDALAYAGTVIYFSLAQLDFRGPAALLDRQSKRFGDRQGLKSLPYGGFAYVVR